LRRPATRAVAILIVLYVASGTTLALALLPERFDVKVGELSPRSIQAPRPVQDDYETRALEEEEARKVQPIYTKDYKVWPAVDSRAQGILDKMVEESAAEGTTEERAARLQERAEIRLSAPAITAALVLDKPQADQLMNTFRMALEPIYNDGTSLEDLGAKRDQALQIVGMSGIPQDQQVLLDEVIATIMRPNQSIDEKATDRAQQEAKSRVVPVMINKGDQVVRQGQPITDHEISVLRQLGLIRDTVEWRTWGGAFLFSGLAFGLMSIYVIIYERDLINHPRRLLFMAVVILLVLLVSIVANAVSSYLMPVAAVALLVSMFEESRMALVAAMAAALMSSALVGLDPHFLVYSLLSGSVAALALTRMRHRSDLLRAGLFAVAAAEASALGTYLLFGSVGASLWSDLGWSIAGGMLSAVMAIGLLPFLENLFGMSSSARLMELSNPVQPVLRKLLVEAPGTYHHSLMVANMAEAAAEEVDADPLLCRVGGYYHDIGKVKRPQFFVENQYMAGNPHDKYPPGLSALVITAHVKDGLEMGKKAKLPAAVLDIIQQHHGTTPVSFFYQKAQAAGEEDLNEQDFRYEGPRPQTKEAAIVMLADSVEAAVRSMQQPNPGQIEDKARQIVHSRLAEGQLDQTDLTLRDLDKIIAAFVQILTGIFHHRIQYPAINTERGEAGEPASELFDGGNGSSI
jgi:putative nucleotidyltransferase with HDIG domain